jgi:hypothetical protein
LKTVIISKLNKVEDNSKVIFIFGEIDCREGILLAVEKFKYETIEEGIRYTIGVYLDSLAEFQDKHNYKVFVHPVIPVLDITRDMVKKFNTMLEYEIDNLNGKRKGQLLWMNFFDDLLTDDDKLKKEFELDGTHINPAYLKVVEKEFKYLDKN